MSLDTESDPFLKEEGLVSPPKRHHSSSWAKSSFWTQKLLGDPPKMYRVAILVGLATSVIWGSLLFYVDRHSPRFYRISRPEANHNQLMGMPISGYKFLMCGTSVQEAKTFGCEYDILANHWVPSLCIDEEAIADYQSDESWYGYAHENRTDLLSLEDMGNGPHYFTSIRDHILHCAMLWRKQYRAFSEGRPYLDSITADREHTLHCVKYLIDMTDRGPDFRHMPIRVDVGFAGCYVRD